MGALRDLLSKAGAWFGTLTARERRLVALAGVALVAFLVFVVTLSFANKASSIRARTAQKALLLEEVQTLALGFREVESQRAALEARLRASNVRLASYLEEKGTRAGLEIPSINPRADVTLDGDKIVESAVEVTLTDIKLNRLVDFLQAVESGPGMVQVKYLRVEPRPASESLTAWLTVATYHLKN